MKDRVIVIRHYGVPFRNSVHAMLLYSGPTHHYVLLLD